MFLLFSHRLTDIQKEDAQKKWKVGKFVSLPDDLQQIWSEISPDISELRPVLQPIFTFLKTNVLPDDLVLVQGDFGATCQTVRFVKNLNAVPVYATTKRIVKEVDKGNAIVKESIFQHRRFRRYE